MEQKNEQSTTSAIKNNKNSIVLVIAIIIVIALVALIPKSRTAAPGATGEGVATEDSLPEGCTETTAFSITTGKPCTSENGLSAAALTGVTGSNTGASGSTSTANAVANSTMMSYEEARAAYAGRSVAIANGCVLTPAAQTFKAGTRILFDNASTSPVAIQFQDKSVTIRPYHYATHLLKTAGTYPITCGGTANAGTITVE